MKNHAFYDKTIYKKIIISLLYLLAFAIIIHIWISLISLSYTFLLLTPVIFVIFQFVKTPISYLLKITKYYSPMYMKFQYNNNIHLHLGTVFDYFYVLKWKEKGAISKKKTLLYMMQGLLKISEEIENNNELDIKVSATTQFLSVNSAKRFGFTTKSPHVIVFANATLNYLNLIITQSFVNNKISFPKILDMKKLVISGEGLINQQENFRNYISFLEKRIDS